MARRPLLLGLAALATLATVGGVLLVVGDDAPPGPSAGASGTVSPRSPPGALRGAPPREPGSSSHALPAPVAAAEVTPLSPQDGNARDPAAQEEREAAVLAVQERFKTKQQALTANFERTTKQMSLQELAAARRVFTKQIDQLKIERAKELAALFEASAKNAPEKPAKPR